MQELATVRNPRSKAVQVADVASTATGVAEPTTLALMGLGFLGSG
jgi:hypothetical protein